jgi:hypothetical protein
MGQRLSRTMFGDGTRSQGLRDRSILVLSMVVLCALLGRLRRPLRVLAKARDDPCNESDPDKTDYDHCERSTNHYSKKKVILSVACRDV